MFTPVWEISSTIFLKDNQDCLKLHREKKLSNERKKNVN